MTARPLLIAYDGSPSARAAARAAAALFPCARAVVLNVQREPVTFHQAVAAARIAIPDDVIAGGIQALNRAAAQEAEVTAAEGARLAADAGLEAEATTADGAGSPWRAIRRVAAERGADVVVCGSRGLGAFSRAALGSTSSGLLLHVGRPVLTVPDGGGDLSGPAVIGFDGSEPSRHAVTAAARLLPGRETIVVNVWESMVRHSLGGRAHAASPVEELKAVTRDLDGYAGAVSAEIAQEGTVLARDHGLEARPETVEAAGSAWYGLLSVSRAAGAAVVVASRGRGGLSSALLGSVSSGLVHNADLPVLVVPSRPAGNH